MLYKPLDKGILHAHFFSSCYCISRIFWVGVPAVSSNGQTRPMCTGSCRLFPGAVLDTNVIQRIVCVFCIRTKCVWISTFYFTYSPIASKLTGVVF